VIALYQHDLTGRPLTETLEPGDPAFARALAHATREHAVQRIQPLERSIMRVALLEMLYPDAVPGEEPIPAEGAIEEAVVSAKTFCGSEAPGFVNGVLGAVLRELRENAQIP